MRVAAKRELLEAVAVIGAKGLPSAGDGARAAFVDRFGPTCAAWLTWQHHRSLRQGGWARFHIDARKGELPPWFVVAVEYLEKRPGWDVRSAMKDGDPVRRWRVRWVGRARPS